MRATQVLHDLAQYGAPVLLMRSAPVYNAAMKQSVYDFLDRSPVARVTAHLDLGEGCAVSIWENTLDRVRYEAPANHTFSLYLQGGRGTRRTDTNSDGGHPGAVCVMPEGVDSEWEISSPFRFVHLYVSDARLRSGFVRTHDCDARRLVLEEATFDGNPRLGAPLAQLAQAALGNDLMQAQTGLADMFAALNRTPLTVRAGLPAFILRRVDDWIDAHLDGAISLDDLADLAGLSAYHFHRMFRLSRGVPPHVWVTECRISRARHLLQGPQPIAEIAAACGFSSQSHLTRVFKRHIGATPAAYRMVTAS